MASRYPPGMSMREFDRATADETQICPHDEYGPDCQQCEQDAEDEAADRKYDEMLDRRMDPDCF